MDRERHEGWMLLPGAQAMITAQNLDIHETGFPWYVTVTADIHIEEMCDLEALLKSVTSSRGGRSY